MNCLNEALGLGLPGNGTLLATHATALGALRGRRQAHRRARAAATTIDGDTQRARRAASRPSKPSKTPWRSTSPWAARPTPCSTSSRSRTRRASPSTMKDIDRLSPQGAERLQGRALLALPRRRRAPRRRHLQHPRRARSRRAHPPRASAPCTRRRWAKPSTRTTSAAPASSNEAERRALAAPGGVRHEGRLLAGQVLRRARPRSREGLHPRRRRTPTARTAASRCSTATSRTRAAS